MATLSNDVWFSAEMQGARTQAKTGLSYSETEIPADAHPCDTIQRLSEAWRALDYSDRFGVTKEESTVAVYTIWTGPK
jgi:hypothetical protein